MKCPSCGAPITKIKVHRNRNQRMDDGMMRCSCGFSIANCKISTCSRSAPGMIVRSHRIKQVRNPNAL